MHESERDRITKEIRRFELAAWDMDAAAGAAQALDERAAPGARHALEAGMVVCYARPFTNTDDWIKPLRTEWLPEDDRNRRLHDILLILRDKWAAHTDRASGRDVVDVGAMWGDDEPLYTATWRDGIRHEVLPAIRALCEAQRDRFRKERQRLEAQLAEPAHTRGPRLR